MVLPMAAASATFVRGKGEYGQIFVRADNVPSGAFLMDAAGNKSYDDNGSQRLTLQAKSNKELYKNGNGIAYTPACCSVLSTSPRAEKNCLLSATRPASPSR